MDANKWLTKYPKTSEPSYAELLEFMPDGVRELFLRFDAKMNADYKVYNKWQRFEKDAGWVYGYCRNYRCEMFSVEISDDCFTALGVPVSDEASLNLALESAKAAYESGYEEKYARVVAEKKAKQIEGAKKRVAREKAQMELIKQSVAPDKLNVFRWPAKVSRRKLEQLYISEARGLLDEDLLDDVGFSFFARCDQALKIRELMDKGQLICHNCGALLSAKSYTDPIECACGYSYTYREYRRSCNSASMPGGRATPIFKAFADGWQRCSDAKSKMLLIDRLVHECHVTLMSGEKGRSVCMNLIEGTTAQLSEMLERLAGRA